MTWWNSERFNYYVLLCNFNRVRCYSFYLFFYSFNFFLYFCLIRSMQKFLGPVWEPCHSSNNTGPLTLKQLISHQGTPFFFFFFDLRICRAQTGKATPPRSSWTTLDRKDKNKQTQNQNHYMWYLITSRYLTVYTETQSPVTPMITGSIVTSTPLIGVNNLHRLVLGILLFSL